MKRILLFLLLVMFCVTEHALAANWKTNGWVSTLNTGASGTANYLNVRYDDTESSYSWQSGWSVVGGNKRVYRQCELIVTNYRSVFSTKTASTTYAVNYGAYPFTLGNEVRSEANTNYYYKISKIPDYAFYNSGSGHNFTSITADYVSTVGNSAFRNCSNATTASIEAATTLGNYVFAGCTKLGIVHLSSDLQNIPNGFFDGCTSLRKVYCKVPGYWGDNDIEVFPNLKTIGDYAYQNCSSIEEITIPATVTSIGEDAFYGCTGVRYVYFKGKVPPTWDDANVAEEFDHDNTILIVPFGCKEAYAAAYPAWADRIGYAGVVRINNIDYKYCGVGNEEPYCEAIGLYGGEITNSYNFPIYTYVGTDDLNDYKSYTISHGYDPKSADGFVFPATRIVSEAFKDRNTVESFYIPDNITEIGADAFKNCIGVKNVTFEATDPATCGWNGSIYDFCGPNDDNISLGFTVTRIRVPEASVNAYKQAYPEWADYIDGYENGWVYASTETNSGNPLTSCKNLQVTDEGYYPDVSSLPIKMTWTWWDDIEKRSANSYSNGRKPWCTSYIFYRVVDVNDENAGLFDPFGDDIIKVPASQQSITFNIDKSSELQYCFMTEPTPTQHIWEGTHYTDYTAMNFPQHFIFKTFPFSYYVGGLVKSVKYNDLSFFAGQPSLFVPFTKKYMLSDATPNRMKGYPGPMSDFTLTQPSADDELVREKDITFSWTWNNPDKDGYLIYSTNPNDLTITSVGAKKVRLSSETAEYKITTSSIVVKNIYYVFYYDGKYYYASSSPYSTVDVDSEYEMYKPYKQTYVVGYKPKGEPTYSLPQFTVKVGDDVVEGLAEYEFSGESCTAKVELKNADWVRSTTIIYEKDGSFPTVNSPIYDPSAGIEISNLTLLRLAVRSTDDVIDNECYVEEDVWDPEYEYWIAGESHYDAARTFVPSGATKTTIELKNWTTLLNDECWRTWVPDKDYLIPASLRGKLDVYIYTSLDKGFETENGGNDGLLTFQTTLVNFIPKGLPCLLKLTEYVDDDYTYSSAPDWTVYIDPDWGRSFTLYETDGSMASCSDGTYILNGVAYPNYLHCYTDDGHAVPTVNEQIDNQTFYYGLNRRMCWQQLGSGNFKANRAFLVTHGKDLNEYLEELEGEDDYSKLFGGDGYLGESDIWWNIHTDGSDSSETTAIPNVEQKPLMPSTNDNCYNLRGQKMDTGHGKHLPKGIYIVNGKKFVVK